ncbi:isochorismatase family protein [Herbiconiux flava]|uniref:Nicotinamidase-related amidase n=1 Tax=Herbiconiux flava TaxID=881268 RepID=A0A852SQ54_9MICO|nr:isochorismatase family protein [Herbiconiux flava]NYD70971.1 nicotinamidase-related amidase [Herbiconiux flava]GLK19068.1 hydrolase [Herbiconiux flava]
MTDSTAPWNDVITDDDLRRYEAAGFGRPSGIGSKPALLIIDAQYRTVGMTPKPFFESVEQDFTTSCGEVGWDALANVARLLPLFRAKGWPVIYPYVAPKKSFDQGRLGAKVPGIMTIADEGYEFVDLIAPEEGEILLPKRHPSAFFGTPLLSFLIERGIDTLVVTGATTSGCVRGTVVDGFSYNFRVLVPHDAVYDRSATVHQVNLFDMGQKYADVASTGEVVELLSGVAPAESAAAPAPAAPADDGAGAR